MDGIEKVRPVYPGWQDKPKKDKQNKADSDESAAHRQPGSQQPQLPQESPDDGLPHFDEFA